jgi:hypothetical protein
MKRYTTYGHVRGQCGHVHETMEAAEACAARDGDGCHSQGGYSDRHGYVVDEDGYLVTRSGNPVWPAHGRSTGAVRAECGA